MNQTIIQERSGLNQFYAKVYAFVGIGIALSAIVSALMLTTFQDLLVQLMLNARVWLIVTGISEELLDYSLLLNHLQKSLEQLQQFLLRLAIRER